MIRYRSKNGGLTVEAMQLQYGGFASFVAFLEARFPNAQFIGGRMGSTHSGLSMVFVINGHKFYINAGDYVVIKEGNENLTILCEHVFKLSFQPVLGLSFASWFESNCVPIGRHSKTFHMQILQKYYQNLERWDNK